MHPSRSHPPLRSDRIARDLDPGGETARESHTVPRQRWVWASVSARTHGRTRGLDLDLIMEVYRGRASCSNALVRPASVGAVSTPSRRSSRWRETTRRRRRLRAEEARATTTTLAEGEGEGDSDGSFDHVMMADLGTADLASLVASNKYKGWLLDQVRLCTCVVATPIIPYLSILLLTPL